MWLMLCVAQWRCTSFAEESRALVCCPGLLRCSGVYRRRCPARRGRKTTVRVACLSEEVCTNACLVAYSTPQTKSLQPCTCLIGLSVSIARMSKMLKPSMLCRGCWHGVLTLMRPPGPQLGQAGGFFCLGHKLA